ncbi:MAG: chain length determinant family protein [Rhodospirillales bacterium]|nr:chain length determinant family protein [Rhodospirillales bacterium]
MTHREPDMAMFLADFWRAKIYMLVGGGLGILAAVVFLMLAVPHYRATMLIAPTTGLTAVDITGLFPHNASFAAEYVAQNPGPRESTDFMRFEQMLRGASVARSLYQDDVIRRGVVQEASFRMSAPKDLPSPAYLAAYLQKHVKIEPVGLTPMRRLVYDHPDPEFAAYLLLAMHRAADDLIRADIAGKSAQRVAWLNEALGRAVHPDHKRALAALLIEQEQIRMILAMDEPFAAAITETAASSPRPLWPPKMLVILTALFAGMVLGYGLYVARKTTSGRRD